MTINEQVAERIISLIENGALKQGEKIPSLRRLSEQLNVSVNTVREAYWKLENRNYIEAVPQSGYFVRSVTPAAMSPECVSPIEMDPREVSICEVYNALLYADGAREIVQLGLALLGREYWPERKMIKFYRMAIQRHPAEAFDYMKPSGYRPLREQIALQGMKAGLRLVPDDIVVTNGCQEALFLCLSAICRHGDSVAVEKPVYFNLLSLLDRLGITPIEIPSAESEGINLDTLSYVLENKPVKAVFVMSNFTNPTGIVLSTEKKRRLLELLQKHDVPLIEDDIHGDLAFGGRPDTCKTYDREGRVLLCSSFSKTLSSGLRLGWVAPGRYYDEVVSLKHMMDIGSPSLNQIAVSLFLREGGYERHLRSIRQGLKRAVAAVRREILERFPKGTSVSDPEGGFILWVILPGELDAMQLYFRALKENILIAPGCLFTRSGGLSNCMRINAGTWNPRIQRAIARLGEMLSR